jgi:AcrR family transcriptional regulator
VTPQRDVPTSTRDRILTVAFDLFAEIGVAGTTISEIERRSGLAAGTGSFYRHFRSKEELLPAAIQHEVTRAFTSAATAFPGSEDARQERAQYLHRVLIWLRETERLNRLLINEGHRVPEIRDAITASMHDVAERLSWDEDPIAVVCVAALNGYLLLTRAMGSPFGGVEPEDLIGLLATLDDRSAAARPKATGRSSSASRPSRSRQASERQR